MTPNTQNTRALAKKNQRKLIKE